jgi:hypothetical protein
LLLIALVYVVWNRQAYRDCQSGEGYEEEFESGQRINCQDLRPWFDR